MSKDLMKFLNEEWDNVGEAEYDNYQADEFARNYVPDLLKLLQHCADNSIESDAITRLTELMLEKKARWARSVQRRKEAVEKIRVENESNRVRFTADGKIEWGI